MAESPKLYVNKPKKAAQMKKVKGIDAKLSSSPVISSYYSTGNTSNGGGSGGGVSKPPDVPKESFARRYKYMWPLLLTVNLAVGAYLFMRTKKKDRPIEEEITNTTPAPTSSTSIAPPAPTAPPTPTAVIETAPAAQPIKVSELIPPVQQHELFKWMLEEKRKIKTNDPLEKKRIDEEKAILKQFIRAKSIPNI
ncbi:uncharacterized protein LOC141614208 isoform X1 [Silene latifolia]|uniref:uncharacterized protein LOC141614208 isoform X1 n=1 Tax=Silene latifolia TaxID=37657 RepID=UPI003D771447